MVKDFYPNIVIKMGKIFVWFTELLVSSMTDFNGNKTVLWGIL